MTPPVSVAVLASGGGTNLQALLDHEGPEIAYRVEVVISDREDAGALERARAAGRDAVFIPVVGRSADDVATHTLLCLAELGIEAVFLAGYLRLVPEAVIEAFPQRILNVHPALLPAFGGKGMYGRHVHEAVIAKGARISGVTVHLVDEEFDTGAILAQRQVPVLPEDDAASLAARVLEAEHSLYPVVADHVCRAIQHGEVVSRYGLSTTQHHHAANED